MRGLAASRAVDLRFQLLECTSRQCEPACLINEAEGSLAMRKDLAKKLHEQARFRVFFLAGISEQAATLTYVGIPQNYHKMASS